MSFIDTQSRVNAAALKRFGEDVLLNSVTVRADFSEPFAQGYMEGVGAEARAPQLIIVTGDVPVGVRGMPVVARGKTFAVATHHPDGFGLSTLMLELA